MSLPNVNINIESGGLGQSVQVSNGEPLLIAFVNDRNEKAAYPFAVKMKELDKDQEEHSPFIYNQIRDFYNVAGKGAPLNLILSNSEDDLRNGKISEILNTLPSIGLVGIIKEGEIVHAR
jgi:hypothetical protein